MIIKLLKEVLLSSAYNQPLLSHVSRLVKACDVKLSLDMDPIFLTQFNKMQERVGECSLDSTP